MHANFLKKYYGERITNINNLYNKGNFLKMFAQKTFMKASTFSLFEI